MKAKTLNQSDAKFHLNHNDMIVIKWIMSVQYEPGYAVQKVYNNVSEITLCMYTKGIQFIFTNTSTTSNYDFVHLQQRI